MHHLRLGLYLVLGLIAAPYAHAQSVTINGVPIEAIGAGKAYIQPDGSVVQGIGFKATPPGATQPSYYQRAVNYTKGTVGGNIKQFAKFGAYSLAFSAILEGMGWALDEITGDIYSTPGQPSPYQATGFKWRMDGYSSTYDRPTLGETATVWMLSYNNPQGYIHRTICSSAYYCIVYLRSGTDNSDWVYSSAYLMTNSNCRITSSTDCGAAIVNTSYPTTTPTSFDQLNNTSPTTATNEQVAEQVAPKLQPDLLDKLSTDPVTGAVKHSQEVLDKMTEIANQLAKEADPAKAPVAAPVASTTVNTTNVASGGQGNIPPFCIWAKPLCDAIDWFKTPSNPKPEDDTEFTFAGIVDENEIEVQSFSSGLGGGTCPDPKTADVLGANLSFSFQPLCDLAGVARIFVLLFAYISSIYILLGMKRS